MSSTHSDSDLDNDSHQQNPMDITPSPPPPPPHRPARRVGRSNPYDRRVASLTPEDIQQQQEQQEQQQMMELDYDDEPILLSRQESKTKSKVKKNDDSNPKVGNSLPYDPSQEDNVRRIQIEGILQKHKEGIQLTTEEVQRLVPRIKQWKLRRGISVSHPSNSGWSSVLAKLNEQRLRTLNDYGIQPRAYTPTPLKLELLYEPTLARHAETIKELEKTAKKLGPINPPKSLIEPSPYSKTTYFPKLSTRWSNYNDTSDDAKKVVDNTNNTQNSVSRPRPVELILPTTRVIKKGIRRTPGSGVTPTTGTTPSTPATLFERINLHTPTTTTGFPGPSSYQRNKSSSFDSSSSSSVSSTNDYKNQNRKHSGELNFMDIYRRLEFKNVSSSSSPLCDRAGAHTTFLRFNDEQYNYPFGNMKWRALKNEAPDKHYKMLKDSIIPTSQVRSLEYYNSKNRSLLPENEQNLIAQGNAEIYKRLLSFGTIVANATVRELESHEVGSKSLWHRRFIPRFMKNMTVFLEAGNNVPAYPQPPEEAILKYHNARIQQTIKAKTIFVDEFNFPNKFPSVSSFLLLRCKDRATSFNTILGKDISYGDMESLLPYEDSPLSFNVMEAIIKILCKNKKISTENSKKYRKWKYFELDDALLDEIQSTRKNTPEYKELETKLTKLGKLNLEVQQNYDFITIIPYFPFQCKLQHEVVVIMNPMKGDFWIFTSKQPTTMIKDFHPIPGKKEKYLPSDLSVKLKRLRDACDICIPIKDGWERKFPKDNYPGEKMFYIPKKFTTKMNDDDRYNNRLLLCRFVEYMSMATANENYYPWVVCTNTKPDHFQIPLFPSSSRVDEDDQLVKESSTQSQLCKLHENFCTFNRPEEIQIKVPDQLIREIIFTTDNFYNWAWPWVKLRYFDMIRHYCEQS